MIRLIKESGQPLQKNETQTVRMTEKTCGVKLKSL